MLLLRRSRGLCVTRRSGSDTAVGPSCFGHPATPSVTAAWHSIRVGVTVSKRSSPRSTPSRCPLVCMSRDRDRARPAVRWNGRPSSCTCRVAEETARFCRWPSRLKKGDRLTRSCREADGGDRRLEFAFGLVRRPTMSDIVRQNVPSAYFQNDARRTDGPTSHVVSVRLSDELVRRLAQVGNDEGRSMSDTIRIVLERGLMKKKAKRRSP